MSVSFPEETLVEAVRTSPPAVRARLLRELLVDHLARGGKPGQVPPSLDARREAELNERLDHLDEAQDLRVYIANLGSSGGAS